MLLDEVESLSRAEEAEARERERERDDDEGQEEQEIRGMTRWERILVEEELKVGYWRWVGSSNKEGQKKV